MKTKNLQSYHTTPEQSKRLLELGVPKNSADCYITWKLDHTPKVNVLDNETYLELLDHISQITIPCWSVGKLQEIFDICNEDYIERSMSYRIEYMIALFELEKDNDMLNFSKLELY